MERMGYFTASYLGGNEIQRPVNIRNARIRESPTPTNPERRRLDTRRSYNENRFYNETRTRRSATRVASFQATHTVRIYRYYEIFCEWFRRDIRLSLLIRIQRAVRLLRDKKSYKVDRRHEVI